MKRFFVSGISGGTHVLCGDDHRHACVCRLKAGDKVVLCEGDGIDYLGTVSDVYKTETVITIQTCQKNQSEPSVEVDLFFAPLSADNTELIIVKGTELGVKNFFPVDTKFTQKNALNLRFERLNKLLLEACKQCGRAVLPKIHPVTAFDDAVKTAKSYDAALLCYEAERKTRLRDALKPGTKSAAVFIGPEGGFCADEAAAAKAAGLSVITLGKRILRGETAALAAVAGVMCVLE